MVSDTPFVGLGSAVALVVAQPSGYQGRTETLRDPFFHLFANFWREATDPARTWLDLLLVCVVNEAHRHSVLCQIGMSRTSLPAFLLVAPNETFALLRGAQADFLQEAVDLVNHFVKRG